ncbi:DUF4082 domain-containing protein [Massilia sp. erpn]|uniref:DUF4082 domain-containing protein n=1 Tax=Massilia sp. erpn TaxID=2738142 RepID=UPI002106A738|nr:DUF4082 domain-containing protein [Massilia sp. erpn]UTY60843.1 DUF4082 domain-containing protein [Massilia sp. erpn]
MYFKTMPLFRAFAAAALMGAAGIAGAGPIPAFEYAEATLANQPSRNVMLGYSFMVAAPTVVTSLAYFSGSGASSHQVGLWDADKRLLASDTVLASDPLSGHYRYHAIDAITLAPGQLYYVAGLSLGNLFAYSPTEIAMAPGIKFMANSYSGATTSLQFPQLSFAPEGGPYIGGSFGVNAVAVPEPGAITLVLTGLGMIGLMACHRRKKH